jgi:hypothetical protein
MLVFFRNGRTDFQIGGAMKLPYKRRSYRKLIVDTKSKDEKLERSKGKFYYFQY